MSFSRRNFIKGAAALTATGALVGCAPRQGDAGGNGRGDGRGSGDEDLLGRVPCPVRSGLLPERPCARRSRGAHDCGSLR
ncbi:twin-arginine translocation signal domain-containing protein [Adlercreutzia equolifaciens]